MARAWGRTPLSGARNGVNTVFTIPGLPQIATTWIYLNGLCQYEVAIAPDADSVVRSGNTVTFAIAPSSTANVWCVYSGEAEEPVLLAEVADTFYYNLWIKNLSGQLVDILEKHIQAARWSYAPSFGGCIEASFVIRRTFDNFGSLAEDYEVELYREKDPLTQSGQRELRWGGYIRDLKPALDEPESVTLECSGWSRQLDQLVIGKFAQTPSSWTNMDVGAIVRDIIDNWVIPGSKIKRTAALALVPDFGINVGTFPGFLSAGEAIRTLAEYAGDAEWGVRADREFYFLPRSAAIRQSHAIGGRIKFFQKIFSSEQKVNRIYIQGTNGTRFIIDGASFSSGNQKERILPVGTIANQAEATLYGAGYFARFSPANAKPSGRLRLEGTAEWIEGVGHPLGLLRVFGGPVFIAIGELGTAETYGVWTDDNFRIHSVNYTAVDDAIAIDVELGARGNKLSDYLIALERKFAELRQMQQ